MTWNLHKWNVRHARISGRFFARDLWYLVRDFFKDAIVGFGL